MELVHAAFSVCENMKTFTSLVSSCFTDETIEKIQTWLTQRGWKLEGCSRDHIGHAYVRQVIIDILMGDNITLKLGMARDLIEVAQGYISGCVVYPNE